MTLDLLQPPAGPPLRAATGSASLPPVLDACCGSRAFWFDKQDSRALFVDKRAGVYPLTRSDTPRAPVVVAPDWQGSFTALPYPTNTFDHVIFDPPHIVESSESGNLAKYYGVLRGEWREELRGGFAECFRVLRPGGTLIFKWNELDVPLREILALTPEKPLYGHKSGKLSKTHWVAFLKPNAEVSGCLRTPMPEDAPRTAAGSPLDRPVGPVAGA